MELSDFSTSQAKDRAQRIDRVARRVAQMERGTYESPTKPEWKPRRDGDAKYHPSLELAFIDEGFSEKYAKIRVACSNGRGKMGEWFQDRLVHHRMLLDGGYKAELAALTNNGQAITALRSLAYESLMNDLRDPMESQKIPFRDRQRLYVDLTKMEAEAKGDARTQGRFTQNNVLAIIQNKINDSSAQNELVDNLTYALEEATEEVEGILDVGGMNE